MRHSDSDRIDPQHPALPGHFPGDPIVPGVLILARVLKVAKASLGVSVHAIPSAKFHAPLKPDEDFTIALERVEDEVKFRVQRAGGLIASGTLRLHRSAPSEFEPS